LIEIGFDHIAARIELNNEDILLRLESFCLHERIDEGAAVAILLQQAMIETQQLPPLFFVDLSETPTTLPVSCAPRPSQQTWTTPPGAFCATGRFGLVCLANEKLTPATMPDFMTTP